MTLSIFTQRSAFRNAVLWVMGVAANGYREYLGVWLGTTESGPTWSRVFRELHERGLHGVQYVVSDEHAGLKAAVQRYFPEAVHQRCQVHYLRNALTKVSTPARQATLLASLRDVWAAPTRPEAAARGQQLVASLRPVLPAVAEWVEETLGDTLGFYVLTEAEARRRLRTTNALEREHEEIPPAVRNRAYARRGRHVVRVTFRSPPPARSLQQRQDACVVESSRRLHRNDPLRRNRQVGPCVEQDGQRFNGASLDGVMHGGEAGVVREIDARATRQQEAHGGGARGTAMACGPCDVLPPRDSRSQAVTGLGSWGQSWGQSTALTPAVPPSVPASPRPRQRRRRKQIVEAHVVRELAVMTMVIFR
jgi:hypothetical protein